jgi:chromosome partitioning protein
MKRISLANQKGGVGKTTVAVSLATTLARRSYRTLLVDLDSQRNATRWSLGGKVPPADHPTTYELITREDSPVGLEEVILPSKFGFDLAPAGEMLGATDSKLTSRPAAYRILGRKLSKHQDAQRRSKRKIDVCLIDCPASFGTLIVQAISASDEVIIPVEIEGMSMQGLGQFLETIDEIRTSTENHDLEVLGILANNFDLRRGITKSGLSSLREKYPDLMFDTEIPMRTKIMEASTRGVPVQEHADGDEPELIESLTDEVIQRSNL